MHHNYAFLWVLLLVQGNDIRFYRGKVKKYAGIFASCKDDDYKTVKEQYLSDKYK